MFDLSLFDDRNKLKAVSIRCINCKKEIGLYLGTSALETMITELLFNAVLNHMGMLWIIWSNKEMLYEMDKINHPDWLNKGPGYNTAICSRLHVVCLKIYNTRNNR